MARGVKGPRRKGPDKQRTGFGIQPEQQPQPHAEDAGMDCKACIRMVLACAETYVALEFAGALGGWVNCECFFSLVLVALLAALPFNLQTHEMMSQSKDSYLNRADALFSDGAFDKAASLYERAVNTEETAQGHLYLAEALMKVNRLDQAAKHYQRAASLFEQPKEKASMFSYLGKLHTEAGNEELALDSYWHVLDLYSSGDPLALADAHVLVAEAMIDTFQHRAAIQQLQKALALAPNHATANLLLAHCLRDLGDFRRAIGRYKRLIQLQPRDFPSLFSLGMTYHEVGEFQPALAMFKRASAVNPNSSEVQLMLAALQQQPYSGAHTPHSLLSSIFDLDARRRAVTAARLVLDASNLLVPPREQTEAAAASSNPPQAQQGQQPKHSEVAVGVGSDGDVHAGDGEPMAEEDPDGADEPDHKSQFKQVYGLRFKNTTDLFLPVITKHLGMQPNSGFQWLDVLELGCGRSELVSHLRSMADRLQCVEVSSISARQLQRGGQYDEVRHADVLSTLPAIPSSSIDLVVATEVVPYFGSLRELFQQLSRVLRSDGLAVFHTDPLADEAGDGK